MQEERAGTIHVSTGNCSPLPEPPTHRPVKALSVPAPRLMLRWKRVSDAAAASRSSSVMGVMS